MAEDTPPAELSDHSATARGRAFIWGGAVLGVLVIILLYTRGSGVFAGKGAPEEPPLLEHRGARIFVPEGSALRRRLSIEAAAAIAVSARLQLPAVVESDPARTAALLPAVGGRVQELKVGLGERVSAGQILAVIDSPDLAQAYDDNAKAADTFTLTRKNLERQEGQAKIGALSERDLDQARSEHRQAAAEYTRTQARLKSIGVSAEAKSPSHLLPVRAPFAGSITALSIATGNMINDPTQPIMTLVHLGTVWVTALVAEKDIPAVAAGQDAEVTLAADPGHVLRGQVLFVSELVHRENRHGAAILTLNRPEKLNALTKEVFEALEEHVDAIARETRTIGLVILRGAGGNFSARYDMQEVLSYIRAHAKPHFNSEVIDKLANLPRPVVSAVQGHCSTGALELALAADLIVAGESARFCDA